MNHFPEDVYCSVHSLPAILGYSCCSTSIQQGNEGSLMETAFWLTRYGCLVTASQGLAASHSYGITELMFLIGYPESREKPLSN